VWRHGLLRFARNDGNRTTAFSRRDVPEVSCAIETGQRDVALKALSTSGCAWQPKTGSQIFDVLFD